MKEKKRKSIQALFGAMAEAESKVYNDDSTDLEGLEKLLKEFLNRDDDPERVKLRRGYDAGLPLTGENGLRKKLGAIDMEFFGRAYFPHYFSRPSPEFHRELDNIWQQGVLKGRYPLTPAETKTISRLPGSRRVVAAPRGHAKSTNLTFKGSMHAVLYQYKHYVIIISDSSDQAEGFLENIRVEFEENTAIREDFGDLTGKVWRSNVLVTSSNIKMEAIGSGKKIRGRKHRNWRPDLLILDDVENDENVRTTEQRAKLDNWFKKAVSKAGDDYTDIVYIGTLLHYDSLLANTLKNPAYRAIKYQAVLSFSAAEDLWQQWTEIFTDLSNDERERDALAFFHEHQAAMLALPSSILGVKSVTNPLPFGGGAEQESDEAFRSRILDKIRRPLTSGNRNHLIYWAKQFSGVGSAKCLGAEVCGPGKARVIVLSDTYRAPDNVVLDHVKDHIEEERQIGADITVVAATPKPVTIDVTIRVASGYDVSSIRQNALKVLQAYIDNVNKADFDTPPSRNDQNRESSISYYRIGDLFFSVDGVADILSYTLNGEISSLSSSYEEYFVLEEVNIGADQRQLHAAEMGTGDGANGGLAGSGADGTDTSAADHSGA